MKMKNVILFSYVEYNILYDTIIISLYYDTKYWLFGTLGNRIVVTYSLVIGSMKMNL